MASSMTRVTGSALVPPSMSSKLEDISTMMTAKTKGPSPGAKRFQAPKSRSTTQVRQTIPRGSSKPTGPLARTARAAAAQKSTPALRPSRSPALKLSNADSAAPAFYQKLNSWVFRK